MSRPSSAASPAQLSHVLANLDKLVVKAVGASGGYGMLVGPHATKAQQDEFAAALKADPDNYIAQPTIQLSTAPCLVDGRDRAAPRRPAPLHPLRREDRGDAGRADPGGAAQAARWWSTPARAAARRTPGCWPTSKDLAAMMLARVADSLYWIGRYVERAEHLSPALRRHADRHPGPHRGGRPRSPASRWPRSATPTTPAKARNPYEAAPRPGARPRGRRLGGQFAGPRPRERPPGARPDHHRDLGAAEPALPADDRPRRRRAPSPTARQAFLHETIADLHLFKGAADATMSHGEGWRFLLLGVYLERAQLIGAPAGGLLRRPAAPRRSPTTRRMISLLRMACALEPYLRVYTADMQPRFILEFLLFDEDFPRSIRFCTARIEEHLTSISRHADAAGVAGPDRLAGRLRARLQYADIDEVQAGGASAFLGAVLDECAARPPRGLRDLRRLHPRTAPARPKDHRPCSSTSATRPATSTTSPCARASWSCGCSRRSAPTSG